MAIGKLDPATGSTGLPSTATRVPLKLPELDPERARGGAVDDPKPGSPAPLDADDQGIVEGSVVRQKRVILDVVQVHRHRHCHAVVAHAGVTHAGVAIRHAPAMS